MTKKQSISIRALHRHNSDPLSVQEYEVAIRVKKMYNLSDLEKELGRPIDNEKDLLTAVFSTLINSVLAGLIALGTTPAGSTLRVYYQTPEGQIGETTL